MAGMVEHGRWGAIAVGVALLVVGVGGGAADAAETPRPWGAHDPHELEFTEIQEVVVDEAHEHLFFTTFNERRVVVTDFSGAVLDSIPVSTRETSMSMSPDGSTVWVTASENGTVYAIDTATLAVTQPLSDVCAAAVIEYDGQLISGGPCGIAVRDLSDLSTVSHSLVGSDYAMSEPYMRVVQAPTPVLVVVELGSTAYTTMTIDAVAWEPIASVPFADKPSSLRTVAVNPNGSELAMGATIFPTRRYSLPNLTRLADYSDSGAAGLAYTSDGSLVASGGGTIRVYAAGSTTPARTFHVLAEMWPSVTSTAGDGSHTAVVSVLDAGDEFVWWLNMLDVTKTAGSIGGTLNHGFPEYNGGVAPAGHVDLFNDEFGYLGTVDAGADGTYTIDEVGAGIFYEVFWNGEYGARDGDPYLITDFFPQLFRDRPLYGSPTPIELSAGEVLVGIDAHLMPLFLDMFASVFANDIYWLGNTGITKGCDPPVNAQYCPDQVVTRGQMAAFLTRALGLPSASGVDFVDDDESVFESAVESLAAAGITKGCNPPINDRFCPDDPVTRGQMAAFLNRAFSLPPGGAIEFDDDNGSLFEEAIERLAAAGVTKGCNPPINDRFCPDDPVTRGQMAAFLHRALSFAANSATQDTAQTVAHWNLSP